MEIRHQLYRLLSLYILPLHIVAFRSRLESSKGGYGARSHHTAIPDYYDERDRQREWEFSNGSRYSFYFDEPYIHELNFFQGSLLNDSNFHIDSTLFGIDNPFDTPLPTPIAGSGFDPCNGDDCEECSIPDEYKLIENPIDALMYLGIQRAKPIFTIMVDD
jgi:hypothetical protein